MASFKTLAGKLVSISLVKRCAILRMKNGENRFNYDFINNLHEALDEVEKCSDVDALITVGHDKFFSNGLDLAFITQSDDKKISAFMKDYSKLMARFLTFPMPTVAAINGHAFAAGGLLAMAHDYRLMREDRGWLCLNEIHLRLRFPPGICEMLAAKSSNKRCLNDLLMFGKRFTGPEALSSQLIDGICNQDLLIENAISLAKSIIGDEQFDKAALRTMKMDLYKNAVSELTRDINFDDVKLLSHISKF